MASMDNPMECGVCQEEFNEDSKCPRTLPCSHHLCSVCINKLICQNLYLCPFCRKPFKANSYKDVMVNRGLVDCMKYMTLKKSKGSTTSLKTSSPYHQKIAEFKEAASESNSLALHDILALKKQAEKMKESTRELRDCQGKLLPHIMKIISEFNHNVQKLEVVSQKLQDHIAAVEEKEKLLNSAKRKLDSASSFQAAAAIMDETEETHVSVKEWAESLRGSLADMETLIQSAKKERILSEKLNEDIMKAQEDVGQDGKDHSLLSAGAAAKQQELPRNITSFDLWRMTPPVKHLIEQGRLYARQNHKIAKITIEDNKLHLYSLEPERESIPNRCYIKYEDVMKLLDSNVLVFLDVCVRESAGGRIRILLNDNAPSDFPIDLTAGSKHSYINTSCGALDKGTLWEQLLWGEPLAHSHNIEYLENNYRFKENYNHSVVRSRSGSVNVIRALNQEPPFFVIRTGPYIFRENGRIETVMGYVTDGLNVLHEASRCVEDVKEIKISSCGVVLSTEVPIE